MRIWPGLFPGIMVESFSLPLFGLLLSKFTSELYRIQLPQIKTPPPASLHGKHELACSLLSQSVSLKPFITSKKGEEESGLVAEQGRLLNCLDLSDTVAKTPLLSAERGKRGRRAMKGERRADGVGRFCHGSAPFLLPLDIHFTFFALIERERRSRSEKRERERQMQKLREVERGERERGKESRQEERKQKESARE